jgi:hypothetical protein
MSTDARSDTTGAAPWWVFPGLLVTAMIPAGALAVLGATESPAPEASRIQHRDTAVRLTARFGFTAAEVEAFKQYEKDPVGWTPTRYLEWVLAAKPEAFQPLPPTAPPQPHDTRP